MTGKYYKIYFGNTSGKTNYEIETIKTLNYHRFKVNNESMTKVWSCRYFFINIMLLIIQVTKNLLPPLNP